LKNNYMPYITEADFQKQVIELAHLFGWKVCEFRKARLKKRGQDTYRTPFGADGMGFPDLVLAREGRLIFIEVKSEKGELSLEQSEWLEVLKATGKCETFLLYPSDFDIIVKILGEGATNEELQALRANQALHHVPENPMPLGVGVSKDA